MLKIVEIGSRAKGQIVLLPAIYREVRIWQ